jgi:hypothetical protein
MTILEDTGTHTATLRVGSDGASLPGPLGTGDWEEENMGGSSPVTLYFQEVDSEIVEHARIVVHDEAIEVPCHRATREQLRIMERTLQHVPPRHLQLLNERKPGGFLMRDWAGAGTSRRYTGGLNSGRNYDDTPGYDERQLIIITYGAFWEYRRYAVCPTALHEIGHVMTHGGEINYGGFAPDRATALGHTTVSRNPSELEALCNTYMFFLCWASDDPDVHDFGSGSSIQNDLVARNGLRRCPAFRRLLGDEAWRARFREDRDTGTADDGR